MTQLVNKASSWRTLRRKVVVGASSLALVAGMGVALAPAASAATTTAPVAKVKIGAPLANNASAGTLTLTATNTDKVNDAANVSGKLTFTLPEGLTAANVNLPAAANTTDGFRFLAVATPDATKPNIVTSTVTFLSTAATGTGASDNAILHDGALEIVLAAGWIDGRTPTNPPATGDITVKFDITMTDGTNYVGSSTASATATFVAPGAPAFKTDAVPAPQPGYSYNYKIVADKGVPAAPLGNYTVIGAHQNDNGTWQYTNDLTVDGNGLIALSSADAASKPHNTGFVFDANTGSIKSVGAVSSNLDSFWTWVIKTKNGVGGASTAVTSNNATIYQVKVALNEVVSKAFDLSVAPAEVSFSDYSKTSIFGTEVWALAGAGIIQGYDDGTFGPNKPVTRQAFAAYVVRTLKEIVTDNSMDSVMTGKCGAAGSSFADVSAFSQFCNEIKWMESTGITEGYDNGRNFKPTAPISRQAIAAMLFRADSLVDTSTPGTITVNSGVVAALPQCTGASAFADVAQDNPFCGAIEWAANTEPAIATGTKVDDTTSNFKPNDATSRQAASTFFYRLANVEYAAANPTATDTFWTK